jgi:hypothetical protein
MAPLSLPGLVQPVLLQAAKGLEHPVDTLDGLVEFPKRTKGDIPECHEVSAQTLPSEQFVAT